MTSIAVSEVPCSIRSWVHVCKCQVWVYTVVVLDFRITRAIDIYFGLEIVVEYHIPWWLHGITMWADFAGSIPSTTAQQNLSLSFFKL